MKGIDDSENFCFEQYAIFGIAFDFTIQQPYVYSYKSYNVSPQITKLTIKPKEDKKSHVIQLEIKLSEL